eukprot:Skav236510  [mRNA]  locus=scaffold78:489370:490032:+ [translate_table: standard]
MSDRRRNSGSIHPASTSLLLKVQVPASGFDVLLSFAVKPDSSLQQVQQGIAEVIDELGLLTHSGWLEMANHDSEWLRKVDNGQWSQKECKGHGGFHYVDAYL